MKNIKVLDCTLRDGGRIIDCAFNNSEIKEISTRLSEAKIDIIEVGFLRDGKKVNYKGNSTFFTDVDQIAPFVKRDCRTLYVAFVDFGMFDFDSLKNYDGNSIDGIRFGFTKKDLDTNSYEVIRCAKFIKEKGYKLFIQGVNTLNYSDFEILKLVEIVNDIHPYSFGIVDTYGAMYIEDLERIYGLIDNNLSKDICINFHSHNNYQLSFALALEVIKLSKGVRTIIIDGTLLGIGKVAGNLNIELLVDYMVRKLYYDYELESILDIIDDYIYKYSKKNTWGYSIPAMMAGIYKSHPNNIIYLTEKFRLDTKDISRLLSMIDPATRQRYDYDNIERLYIEYIGKKIDDTEQVRYLKNVISGKKILVLVPGNSLNTYAKQIDNYINENDIVVISVNFIYGEQSDYAFYANPKRYNKLKNHSYKSKIIASSNLQFEKEPELIVDYYSLINKGNKYFENSTIMLLNLLKRIEPGDIAIAGFDGFNKDISTNYYDSSFENERHISEFDELNAEIKEMFDKISFSMKGKCEIHFLTPSMYMTENDFTN